VVEQLIGIVQKSQLGRQIGVDADEAVAPGVSGAEHKGPPDATLRNGETAKPGALRRQFFANGARAVGRSVIYDDDLVLDAALRQVFV
jgi:hypothetical protein